jgi:hypothetical protein
MMRASGGSIVQQGYIGAYNLTTGTTQIVLQTTGSPGGIAVDPFGDIFYTDLASFGPYAATLSELAINGSTKNFGQVINTSAGFISLETSSNLVYDQSTGQVLFNTPEITASNGSVIQPGAIDALNPATGAIFTIFEISGNPQGVAVDGLGNIFTEAITYSPVQSVLVQNGTPGPQLFNTSAGFIDAGFATDVFALQAYVNLAFSTGDGTVPVWGLNGSQIAAAAYTTLGGTTVGVPAPGWNIVDATGDFSGNGNSDILWQTSTGQVAIWEMNGSQIQSAAYTTLGGSVVGVPAPGWQILGVADFFGAGDNDILWQTGNGSPAIWEMNGTQIVGASYTTLNGTVVGAPGPDWHIIGAGDFTGNGQDDLLWRTDNGALAIWEMNGFQITDADYIREGSQQINAPGPDWHLITTGDFTGNGMDDLLWETNSGAIAIWEMDGTQITAAGYVSENGAQVNAPPGWKLAGAADVAGNGKDDLLWQTPSGQAAVWEMNGTQIVGAAYLTVAGNQGSTPPDWSIIQHSYNLI